MNSMFEIIAFGICAFISIAGALGMTTTMSMFRSGIFLMASFIGVAGLFILLAADLIGLLQIMMYIGGFLVMILFMVLVMHDPGGAMMAGMDMTFVERWFSKGLVPKKAADGDHMQGNHGHSQFAHKQHAQDAMQPVGLHSREEAGTRGEKREDHRHQSTQRMHHSGHDTNPTQHNDGHSADQMGGMDMSMVTPVRPAAAWLAFAIGLVLVGMLLLRPNWREASALPDPDSARRVGHLLMEKYMVAFEGAGFLILIGIFGAVLLARPSSYPDESLRSARVAVAETPTPIADDALVLLAGPEREEVHADNHGSAEEHGA